MIQSIRASTGIIDSQEYGMIFIHIAGPVSDNGQVSSGSGAREKGGGSVESSWRWTRASSGTDNVVSSCR